VADPSGVSYQIEIVPLGLFGTPMSAYSMVLPDGVYSWRVRAVDGAGNAGAWSQSWAFTVDTSAPADTTGPPAPTLVAPPDGSTVLTPQVPLDWGPVADPSGIAGYYVEVSQGGVPVYTADVVGTQTDHVTAPLGNGTYSWRVRATFGAGNAGAWSATWTFTVNPAADGSPPAQVQLIAPPDGSTVTTPNVTFTWFAAADAGSGVAYYVLEVDSDPLFPMPVAYTIWTSGTTAVAALPVGTWFRRVRAVDWAGNTGAWSEVWAFVKTTPPAGGGAGGFDPTDGSAGPHGSGKCFLGFHAGAAPLVWTALALLLAFAAALSCKAGRASG
jgi:hypothetical protein